MRVQRISRQRADDVDALAGRLEAGRQAGKRATIFAGEFDPDGFDETARWLRSGARDDPVAADRLLPVPGVEYQFAGADLCRAGLAAYDQPALALGFLEQLDVGALGAGEIRGPVENRHDIALRLEIGRAHV